MGEHLHFGVPIWKPDLVILGAGGFAREVALVIKQIEEVRHYQMWDRFAGFLTDDEGQWYRNITYGHILGSTSSLKDKAEYEFIPGIGSPALREKLVEQAKKDGIPVFLQPLISPKAMIGKEGNQIGLGTIICMGSSITVDITLGNYVNVNLNCTIGHDSVVEDYCNLSPGVHLSGHVHLEKGVDVGTGAVILPGVHVGKGATIGAGAMVRNNVEAGATVVGVPAKRIK